MTFAARFIARSAWGARSPRENPRSALLEKGQAIHWTWEPSQDDTETHWPDCYNALRGVQNYHMDSRGWNDIAYNFVICPHGFIFEGRGWTVRNGATGTAEANENYLAVCFIMGKLDEGKDEYLWAGQDMLAEAISRGARDLQRPHSFFKSTTCPGNWLRSVDLYEEPSAPDPRGPHALIMGPPTVTFDQAMGVWNGRGVYPRDTVKEIIRTYWRLCLDEGVDFGVAIAQVFKETGYFQYGGDVSADQWNFAGIGATGGVPGVDFASIHAGAWAHVRRLRMYAEGTAELYDLSILVRELDERHWGAYPTTWEAGEVWAKGTNYNVSWVEDYILPLRNWTQPSPEIIEMKEEGYWVEGGIEYALTMRKEVN